MYGFTTVDHLVWSLERVPFNQTPFKSAKLCLMIQLTTLEDQLPSYQEAMMTDYVAMPEPVMTT